MYLIKVLDGNVLFQTESWSELMSEYKKRRKESIEPILIDKEIEDESD